MGKRISNYLTLDEVAELLKVEAFEKYDDWFINNNGCTCSEELTKEGKCECGFEDERSRLWDNYESALLFVAEKLLKEHGLKLEPTKKAWRFKLVPIVSWKHAATQIMNTIEGYGMFDYNHKLKEFLSSGPYTPYQAVMQHTHWMKEYYAVYGEEKAQGQVDRRMRSH